MASFSQQLEKKYYAHYKFKIRVSSFLPPFLSPLFFFHKRPWAMFTTYSDCMGSIQLVQKKAVLQQQNRMPKLERCISCYFMLGKKSIRKRECVLSKWFPPRKLNTMTKIERTLVSKKGIIIPSRKEFVINNKCVNPNLKGHFRLGLF